MYNGKFERGKEDAKQTFLRYLPLIFIVLISAIIVLSGYLLCMFTIDAFKAMYEFFVTNIDKLTFSNDVFVVLGVVVLLVAFAMVIKKFYFGEMSMYYSDENAESTSKDREDTKLKNEPKMVCKREETVIKPANPKRKSQVQNNKADYDVSLNEVVWTNEEQSNRYGFKF